MVTGNHFLAALIVLACVLVIEMVAIVLLICKLARARRRDAQKHQAEAVNEADAYAHYSAAPLVLLGAIPHVTGVLLGAVMIAVAVMSLILVVLLIVVRAAGYDLVSRKEKRAVESQQTSDDVMAAYAAEPAEEQDFTPVYNEEALPEEEESPIYAAAEIRPIALTEEAPIEEEEPIEEAEEVEQSEEAEAAFAIADGPAEPEVVETAEIEDVKVQDASDEAVAVSGEVIPAPVVPVEAPAAVQTTQTVHSEGGQGPVKIVEKVVTETYKEVIKEVPAAEGGATKDSRSSDRVIEKLTDLLEQALQQIGRAHV